MTASPFAFSTLGTDLTHTAAAGDLVDLAWELTCSAGIVAGIDVVGTERGLERCVSALCVSGERAFMLVPRGPGYVDVFWGEYDQEPAWVGVASDVESIMALARRTLAGRTPALRSA